MQNYVSINAGIDSCRTTKQVTGSSKAVAVIVESLCQTTTHEEE